MNADKAVIAAATVRFVARAGQGVVVPGRLIVTAAHVIEWDGNGRMALGVRHLETLEIGGLELMTELYAAEPVSDIAILRVADDQAFPEATTLFGSISRR